MQKTHGAFIFLSVSPFGVRKISNPSILKGKAKEKLPRLAQAGPAEAMNAHRSRRGGAGMRRGEGY